MRAPACISMGVGVRMRKRRKGGVIASRLEASAKKGKTSSQDLGMSWVRFKRCIR